MSDPQSQMLEARDHIAALLRASLPVVAVSIVGALVLEMWFAPGSPVFTFGVAIGCAYALANLLLLFWLIAPFFFFREKLLHAVGAVLASLLVGSGLIFAVSIFGQRWGLGYALGVASPAFFGALRSLQIYATTSKTENG